MPHQESLGRHRSGAGRCGRSSTIGAAMQAVYYRNTSGHEPVNDFIDALAVDVQEEIDYTICLLNRLTATDPPLRSRSVHRSRANSANSAVTTDAGCSASSIAGRSISSSLSTRSRSGRPRFRPGKSQPPRRAGQISRQEWTRCPGSLPVRPATTLRDGLIQFTKFGKLSPCHPKDPSARSGPPPPRRVAAARLKAPSTGHCVPRRSRIERWRGSS